jgi:hypothetical protein
MCSAASPAETLAVGGRAVEDEVGVEAAVVEAVDGVARYLRKIRDDQHRHAGAIGIDDGDIGAEASRNAGRCPVEAIVGERHARERGQRVRSRSKGDRTDCLAAREIRKPFRLLLVAAVELDRLGGAEAAGEEGRAAEATPRLMRDQPQLDEPEVEPAIGLGKGEGGPALFLRGVPEALMILAAGFEQRQQLVLVHPGFEHAPRFGRDRLLALVV